ncbi:hypothetical protein [Actinokineospora spheciospongiae]|uniref:hypothetical protein n=1 Tax=Actinokineospora spheciospongiae TaxID=909613 RepID=UPI0005560FE3|nr:hypothetical protein [Actinokineospora spheciospongiae]
MSVYTIEAAGRALHAQLLAEARAAVATVYSPDESVFSIDRLTALSALIPDDDLFVEVADQFGLAL